MPIAPVRSGGEGGGGAPGGPLNRKRYKPTQAEIDVSLAKGEKTQEAEMVKAGKEFAEDMEPWQWDEYKKGWAGPHWDKKKKDFIWSNIPGKHPDFPLAKQIAGKKERLYRTSSSTRMERSASDVFSKGGIPGMGTFLGMIGVAASRSATGSLLSLAGLTKTQAKYLPGKAKFHAEFKELQKASDLVGDELKKANEILWKYEVDDIAKLTKEQEHLVVHEVKTGEKIQAKASVLKARSKNKEFADDQGKGAELETKVTAQAGEAAEAKKKLEQAKKAQVELRRAEADRLANKYVDESTARTRPHSALSPKELEKPRRGAVSLEDHEKLSARGKEVTRQTKPYEGVASERRAKEFQGAVDQDFGLDEAARARIAGAPTPKVAPKKSASQIIEPEPAPAPRGKPRTERVDVGGRDLTPEQADLELSGMIGGTPGAGATRTSGSKPKMSAPDDVSVISTQARQSKSQQQLMDEAQRMQAAEGLGRARLDEAAKVAAQEARAEVAAAKTIDDLLNQATTRSKRPKAGTPLEELEAWADQRTEVIANIRQKMQTFPNAEAGKVQAIEQALARLESTVVPAVRAEVAPLRKAADEAAKVASRERAQDVLFFNKLTKQEKKAILTKMGNDLDKVFDHVRMLRTPEKLTQPRMAPDVLGDTPTSPSKPGPASITRWPKADLSEPTSLRQIAARQLGPESVLEKAGAVVGRGAKKVAGGGLGAVKAGFGGALKRPTLATIGAVGATGAGVYAYDENQKAKEAELKAQQKVQQDWQADVEETSLSDQAILDTAQPMREAAAVSAQVTEGDWWNGDAKAWAREFKASPAAKELWRGHLEQESNRADLYNYSEGNYNEAQKNQFISDNKKSFVARFQGSAKARKDFRSKLGTSPDRPPLPNEAWVPTKAESDYTKAQR